MILETKTRVHRGITFEVRKLEVDGNKWLYEVYVTKPAVKQLEVELELVDALLKPVCVDYRNPVNPLVQVRKLQISLKPVPNFRVRRDTIVALLHRLCLAVIQDTFVETRRWGNTASTGYVVHYLQKDAPVLAPPKVETWRTSIENRLAELDARFGPGLGASRERAKLRKALTANTNTK